MGIPDALREDDLRAAAETPPGEKLLQALELASDGIALKRVALRVQHPNASEAEVEALWLAWLARE